MYNKLFTINNNIISFIILFTFTALSYASFLENLSLSVVYLRENNKNQYKFGTGFFVVSSYTYLVTASHIARFITAESFFTVRDSGDVPLTFSFSDYYPNVTRLPWNYHDEADVAILKISIPENYIKSFNGRFLPIEMFLSKEEAPQRERPLIVMGFPLALGTKYRFSPITVESKSASGLLRINRLDTNTEATFFVIDKPGIGGFSGAPVFLMPWAYSDGQGLIIPNAGTSAVNPKCVGLVHGTLGDITGGKLAMIVPSYIIVELITDIEINNY